MHARRAAETASLMFTSPHRRRGPPGKEINNAGRSVAREVLSDVLSEEEAEEAEEAAGSAAACSRLTTLHACSR